MKLVFALFMLTFTCEVFAQPSNLRAIDEASPDGLVFDGIFVKDGSPNSFELFVKPNSAVRVDVISSGLAVSDPILAVYDRAKIGPTDIPIKTDDDSGSGLSALTYLYGGIEGKRFVLRITDGLFGAEERLGTPKFQILIRNSSFRPSSTRIIDSAEKSNGIFYPGEDQIFRLEGLPKGQIVVIGVTPAEPEEFLPRLALFAGAGTGGEMLGVGRMSLGARTVSIRHVVSSEDALTLSIGGRADGASSFNTFYTLEDGPMVLSDIKFFDGTSGTVADGNLRGVPILHSLSEESLELIDVGKDRVVFDLESNSEAVDPFLEFGIETDLGFVATREDDDSGDNLNARLIVDFRGLALDKSSLRNIRLRVSSLTGDEGEYRLKMRRLPRVQDE